MASGNGISGYEELTGRLNKFPQGAPPSESLYRIFALLFTEDEAKLLSRLPLRPFRAGAAARAWKTSKAEARATLDGLAERGLLLDGEHEGHRTYLMLPPITGFFEFSLMRLRGHEDEQALAQLLYAYINEEDEFVTMLFGSSELQYGRAMVHERALEHLLERVGRDGGDAGCGDGSRGHAHDDRHETGHGSGHAHQHAHGGEDQAELDHAAAHRNGEPVEVLDYERASRLIVEAEHRALSNCFCRLKQIHAGHGCDAPLEICMSFDFAAQALLRHGHARSFDAVEGLELLERARESHLLQFAENVCQSPKFLCHCCPCCCESLVAARRFGFLRPVHTTNFIAVRGEAECRGCGRCTEACPMDAVRLHGDGNGHGPIEARIDEEVCLGCGICTQACHYGALQLRPRARRVFTPVNSAHRMVLQAIETDTLPELVFDNQGLASHRAAAAVLGAVLRLPPLKQGLVTSQMKSRYLARLCDRPRWRY